MDFILYTIASGLASAALVGFGAWLLRAVIQTRLRAAVEHEFNTKLAALQSDLRQRDERHKDDLREKAVEIQALQNDALAARARRQGATDKRKLEAIDQLWAGITALRPATVSPRIWTKFNYAKCLTEAAKNPKFRAAFAALGSAGEAAVKETRGEEARPHVTKLAWAYFEAYRAIIGFYVARLIQLQNGVDQDFTDQESVKMLAIAALPHYEEAIKEFGGDILHKYLDELEEKLLNEFTAMLAGKDDDVEGVRRAAEILKVAKQFNQTGPQEFQEIDDGYALGDSDLTSSVARVAWPAAADTRQAK